MRASAAFVKPIAKGKAAVEVTCWACGKQGHYKFQCRSVTGSDKGQQQQEARQAPPKPKPKPKAPPKQQAQNQQQNQSTQSTLEAPSNRRPKPKPQAAEAMELDEEPRQIRRLKGRGKTCLVWETRVGGKPARVLVDTGATVSVMSSEFASGVRGERKEQRAPIKVGDGGTMWSHGTLRAEVEVLAEKVAHEFLVVESRAVDCLVGMDLLGKTEGVLFHPPALLVNGQRIPLTEETNPLEFHLMRRLGSVRGDLRESFSMTQNLRQKTLQEMGERRTKGIDLFASERNAREELFVTKETNAFRFDWGTLSAGDFFVWA